MSEVEQLRAENERLRATVKRLTDQLEAVSAPPPAPWIDRAIDLARGERMTIQSGVTHRAINKRLRSRTNQRYRVRDIPGGFLIERC